MKHQLSKWISVLLVMIIACNVCLVGAVSAAAPAGTAVATKAGEGTTDETLPGAESSSAPQPTPESSEQPQASASAEPSAVPSAEPTEEPTPGPHVITVAVTGADTAEAIDNAVVVIYPEGSSPEGEDAVTAAHVEGGEYTATGFHNGTYYISVSAPGYLDLTEHKQVTLQGGSMISIREEVTLVKDTRVTYSGVVTDARGVPVAGMNVAAAKDAEAQNGICDEASDVTETDGRFELLLDSSAEYTFSLSQYGKVYLSETVLNPTQTQDANYALQEFYLTRAALLDEAGQPAQLLTGDNELLDGRRLQVIVGGIPTEIQADEDATFVFLGSREPCNITVPSQGQFFEKTVSIPDCSVKEDIFEITLQQITLDVVVKDENGEAIKAIDYRVINNDVVEDYPLIFENSIRSEEGVFELNCLDASAKTIQLMVSAEGYASAEQQIELKAHGPLEPIEVVLKRGKIALTVLDSKQVPQSNCTIETDRAEVTVEKSGSAYALGNVPVGEEFSISISKSGFETQVFHTLVADDGQRSLTCYLTTPTTSSFGKVSGTVADEAGNAIEGVLVRVGKFFEYTDANGRYSFSQLSLDQTYDLEYSKAGYVSQRVAEGVSFNAEDTSLTLDEVVLSAACDMTVTVVEEGTQTPVNDALLTSGTEEKVYSYGNGTYVLSGVPKDTKQISVSAPGFVSKIVDISAGQENTAALTRATAETRQVAGYVRNQEGVTLAGAKVSMGAQSVLTDANGYFVFYHVPENERQIKAEKQGYTAGELSGINEYAELLLKSNQSANARIEGIVLDDEDERLEGARAEIYYIDGRGDRQTIDTATSTVMGGFTIKNLQKGKTYQLRVSKDGYSTYEAEVEAQSDAVNYVRLSPAGTYTLAVLGPDERPVSGATCYVPALDRYFKTNAEGKAVIDGLLFDTGYDIYIYSDGYLPVVRSNIKTTEGMANLSGVATLEVIPQDKATLTGTVTDKNTGAPIAGAVVSCGAASGRAVTDERGYYSLPGVTKSTQVTTVSASKDGFYAQVESVVPMNAEHKVNLTMERLTGTISGKVLDYDGNPLSGIYVEVAGRNVMTLGDGSYVLEGVSVISSSTTVSYRKLGYITETQRVNLSKTKTEETLPAVTLRKSCSPIIRLRDMNNGSVVTDATVKLVDANDRTIEYPMSLFSEYFTCEDIPEGEYVVNIVSDTHFSPQSAPTIYVSGDISETISLEARTVRPTTRPGGGGKPNGGSNGGGGYTPSTTTPTPQPVATPTAVPEPTESPEWQGFQDMANPNLSWAVTPVYELVDAGVIAEDVNFRPDDNITREEFIKMLVEAFDFYQPDAESNFIDAEEGDWFYPYVASAAMVGILNGYEDGSFGAGQQISRQDMAVLSYRAALLSGRDIPVLQEEEEFADRAQISEYAREAVTAMQCAGIINGMGDGTFAPQNNATRAQAAKIMYGLWTLPVL